MCVRAGPAPLRWVKAPRGHNPPMRMPHPALADSAYAQPFELLDACHGRVRRSLDLLARLLAHLAARQGQADAQARSAADDVLRYFDIAAPLHHQDEERHLFPRLAGDAALAPLCARLLAEHRLIEQQWQALRGLLQRLDPAELPALGAAAEAFMQLHQQHLHGEDGLVFPAVQALLGADAQRAMGIEMAARRGLDLGDSDHQ